MEVFGSEGPQEIQPCNLSSSAGQKKKKVFDLICAMYAQQILTFFYMAWEKEKWRNFRVTSAW